MSRTLSTDAKAYLSWKRIVLMSLALSVGFHFVFMLAFFFGESILGGGGHPMGNPKPFMFIRVLMHTAFSFFIVCGIFFFIRWVFRKGIKRGEVLIVCLGSLLLSASLSIFFSYLPSLFDQPRPNIHFIMRMVRDGLTRDLSLAALVIMICYLLRTLYRQKLIAVENEELRTENIRTHYEALKSQLDPHFLFNSMNTLQSLIEIDKEQASDYVQQLSSVLRYTLQSKEVVTLAEEMACVQAYCSMMEIRYGDNLKFDVQIDKKYNNAKVLPLAVQGLVENAIKHNVISAKQPLVIQIVTTENGLLEVSNAIHPKIKEEAGKGIGLANLLERYRLQWNKEVEIRDDGKCFKVTIPLIEK